MCEAERNAPTSFDHRSRATLRKVCFESACGCAAGECRRDLHHRPACEMSDPLAVRSLPAVPLSPTAIVAGAAGPPVQSPALVYLAGLSASSRRPQLQALDGIATMLTAGAVDARYFPWPLIRYEHVAAVRAWLAERYAPATANRHLSALRGVLRAAWRLGQLSAEDYHRAVDVNNIRGVRLPAGREIARGEMLALFRWCATDRVVARGARDAALLALLYGAGLRRDEAAGLEVSAFEADRGRVRVLGKGHKERLAHLGGGATVAVEAWLRIRGEAHGALICPVTQRGDVQIRRMSGQSIRDAMRRLARRSGVAPFSPHDARRTFVGDLLDAGADLSAVQQLAGHASPATTARYDRRGERAKSRAASLLHLPYVAP